MFIMNDICADALPSSAPPPAYVDTASFARSMEARMYARFKGTSSEYRAKFRRDAILILINSEKSGEKCMKNVNDSRQKTDK